MKFFCPQCGQKLACNDDEQGTVVSCPNCANEITVPTLIKKATVIPENDSNGSYTPSPTNDEEVVLLRGGTYWAYYSHLLVFAIIFGIWGYNSGEYAGLLYFVALLFILNFLLKTMKHSFVLTNKRLTVTNGILIKQEDQIRIPDIRGIAIRREFFDASCDAGIIAIGTSATSDHEIILFHVRYPQKIVEKIEELRKQVK